MADNKPEQKTTSQAPRTESQGRPGESSDPQVQSLLAQRQTAEMNDDDATVAEVDRRLADLGYRQ